MTRYLTPAEFWILAELVTETPVETLMRASRSDLADSALHAPRAGFAEVDVYPDPIDKAAVLVCRIAWNHPLPDGNKRAAWACLSMFIELNGGHWDPDPPDVERSVDLMLRIAAREVDEEQVADELAGLIRFD